MRRVRSEVFGKTRPRVVGEITGFVESPAPATSRSSAVEASSRGWDEARPGVAFRRLDGMAHEFFGGVAMRNFARVQSSKSIPSTSRSMKVVRDGPRIRFVGVASSGSIDRLLSITILWSCARSSVAIRGKESLTVSTTDRISLTRSVFACARRCEDSFG